MCGLAGFLSSAGIGPEELQVIARRMADAQAHRGPDDSGVWVDPTAGFALGFRRLAILDLSPAGHQPMESQSGRFVIAFNGEIYNFKQIRAELETFGCKFEGNSDTEVILAAVERWGVRPAVQRLNGMFAVALWDKVHRRLYLVRDRLGIKPLFVYREPGLVAFSSEMRGLFAGPSFDFEVDPDGVADFLECLYVPAPRTILRGVEKILPGTIWSIGPGDDAPVSEAYWTLDECSIVGQQTQFRGSPDEAVDELDELLSDAVRMQMVADVPVGALLSGGIDSSVVVALMQRASTRPIKTYTIGFDNPVYDEGAHAAAVAKSLGTEHSCLRLADADVLGSVPSLWNLLDDPIADPSILPTLLVSRLARQDVTVALTGDGGDELFAGYNRYVFGDRMIRGSRPFPWAVRRVIAGLGGAIAGNGHSHRSVRGKLGKISSLFGRKSAGEMYRSLHAAWLDADGVVLGTSSRGRPNVFAKSVDDRQVDLLSAMQLVDQQVYLPDDLLAKVDRASMAVSLETRVPILDHRVVEFSWRLPRKMKLRGARGKWVLRQVLHRYVPQSIVERPKMGFSVPIESWLRGPLKEWGTDLLGPDRGRRLECIDWGGAWKSWEDFQLHRQRSGLSMWALLVLAAWHETWSTKRLETVAT